MSSRMTGPMADAQENDSYPRQLPYSDHCWQNLQIMLGQSEDS